MLALQLRDADDIDSESRRYQFIPNVYYHTKISYYLQCIIQNTTIMMIRVGHDKGSGKPSKDRHTLNLNSESVNLS